MIQKYDTVLPGMCWTVEDALDLMAQKFKVWEYHPADGEIWLEEK